MLRLLAACDLVPHVLSAAAATAAFRDATLDATAHDALDREIDALDNTCYECFGCGKESPLDESGGDCKTCNGKGYIPASKS